ncbi:unnamed protein product [Rotaria magnacalcarata]
MDQLIDVVKMHRVLMDSPLNEDGTLAMWSAYIASINDALSLVESKTVFLPSNLERLFGYVWARLINLIGMSRKNINLSETIKNQRAFLPRRMLLDSDRSK